MTKARITLTMKILDAEILLEELEEHLEATKDRDRYSQSAQERRETLNQIASELRYSAGVNRGY